ncbi:MAG: hypothetical protein QOI08_3352 [Actinomycetota bacterium]|jgi:hypothetical protein|nr:hypothetical protein [Actinomycetota bacterium]
MKASPPEKESPLRADTPVFVDDSGRRLARARVVIRGGVVLVGAYVVLVVIGLTGSATLPALHLADLGRLPAPSASAARLGKGSKAVALPAALRPGGSAKGALRSASNASGRSRASHGTAVIGGSGSAGGVPTPGSAAPPATTPTLGNTPTTLPPQTTATTATTVATTTTTRAHGPPTSRPHGPPSTRGRSGQ